MSLYLASPDGDTLQTSMWCHGRGSDSDTPYDVPHRVDSVPHNLTTSAGPHSHRGEAPERFRRLEDPSRRPFVAVPTVSPQLPKHTPNFGGH